MSAPLQDGRLAFCHGVVLRSRNIRLASVYGTGKSAHPFVKLVGAPVNSPGVMRLVAGVLLGHACRGGPSPALHVPGNYAGPQGGHTGMHARLGAACQAGTCRQRGPDAVRYLSVDTATPRPTAIQGDTHRDRAETARLAENSQLAGHLRSVWQVLDSNQRRLSRRFYRSIPGRTTPWPLTSGRSQRAADR
jgi:hypothetical protein